MIRVIVRPLARFDVDESRRWYRDVDPALAAAFMESLNSAVASIRENPEAYPLAHGRIRRILLRGFPYSVFYEREAERLVVIAVFHQARNPHSLNDRS